MGRVSESMYLSEGEDEIGQLGVSSVRNLLEEQLMPHILTNNL
jgi:hypothetical protein